MTSLKVMIAYAKGIGWVRKETVTLLYLIP